MGNKYRVTFSMTYEVEAEDEDEALNEAEDRLVRDFEQPHIGVSELMTSQVNLIKVT